MVQIENLLEQLKDKDKQLAALRERVQGLQTDSSNTETALSTLEEALSEKVPSHHLIRTPWGISITRIHTEVSEHLLCVL